MFSEEFFMRMALQEAAKTDSSQDVPVGAVIILKNKVIARACNQVELLGDPTAHAEMLAVTAAAGFLKSKRLADCVLYVTIEPCSMCAGALVLSRISKVVYGAADPKTGAAGSVFDILHNKKLNHRINVAAGVLAPECALLLRDFFQKKRSANN